MEESRLRETAARLKAISATVMKSARQGMERSLREEGIGVTFLALKVMRAIKAGECTMGALSRMMGIAPASLVPVIDSLEQKGLMKRGSDPEDRRKNPLTLTQKGEAVLNKARSFCKDEMFVKALSKIGERKSAQLVSLLEEFALELLKDDPAAIEAIKEVRCK